MKHRRILPTRVAWSFLTDTTLPSPLTDGEKWEAWWFRNRPDRSSPGTVPSLRGLWADHKERILEEWITARPGTRPSLWWKWDAPEPRVVGESEAAYLARLGLLTDAERAALD